jgi:hypothetical protein
MDRLDHFAADLPSTRLLPGLAKWLVAAQPFGLGRGIVTSTRTFYYFGLLQRENAMEHW